MEQRSQEVRRRNRLLADRAEKAKRSLESYGYGSGREFLTALIDLLVDVLHCAEAEDVMFSFKEISDLALRLYRAEHPQALEEQASAPSSDSEIAGPSEASEE